MQYYLAFPLQVEGMKTIQQSLKLYSKKEIIQDFSCSSCKKTSNSELGRTIIKLPEVFVF